MDMRRALKDKLANYKIPQELKVVEELPKNAMGKSVYLHSLYSTTLTISKSTRKVLSKRYLVIQLDLATFERDTSFASCKVYSLPQVLICGTRCQTQTSLIYGPLELNSGFISIETTPEACYCERTQNASKFLQPEGPA